VPYEQALKFEFCPGQAQSRKKWSQRDATYKKRTVKTIPPHPGAGSFVRQFGGLSWFAAGP